MSQAKISKTILESLFGGSACKMYPVQKPVFYAATRGHIEIEVDKCIFCGICQKKCPTGAITVSKPNRDWEIERMKCIMCNACVEVCPKKCLAMANQYPACGTTKQKERFHSDAPPPKPAAPATTPS